MDLSGLWKAQLADEDLRRVFHLEEFDDASWPSIEVPGHWRTTADFAATDGPLLYRRRFTYPTPAPDAREPCRSIFPP